MIKLIFCYFRSLVQWKEGWRWTEVELEDGGYLCGFTKHGLEGEE